MEQTDPSILYAGVLSRNNISSNDLEYILHDYLRRYNASVYYSSMEFQHIGEERIIEQSKHNIAKQLVADLLEGKLMPIKWNIDKLYHLDRVEVRLETEMFDFNKYDKVFRPERLI